MLHINPSAWSHGKFLAQWQREDGFRSCSRKKPTTSDVCAMRFSPKDHTIPVSSCPALPSYPRSEHIALRKSDRASIAARAIPIMHVAILMLALAILLHHLANSMMQL
jgi:hypothetical protein